MSEINNTIPPDDENKKYNIPDDDTIKKILENQSEDAKETAKDPEKAKKFIKDVLDKLQNIPYIGAVIEDIRLLCSMVGDYVTGKYKEVPLASLIMIIAGLGYFLSPIDLIPDFIPVIGYIDDIAVITFIMMTIHNDIQSYRTWLENKTSENEPV